MRTFEQLTNRYKLTCTLLAEESLHVGSGLASATTDAPFVLENNQPFLPGSGLRGSLRSRVESIVHSLPGAKQCCVLFAKDNPPDVCDAGNEERRKLWEKATASEVDGLLARGLRLCPVCELFGSTIKAAKLKISDATLLTPGEIVRRDGVGIDRDTGRAAEHIKYDFEVLSRGCKFTCRILLENAEPDDLALLYVLLHEWKAGVDLGGKKSRGLGRVRLETYTLEWFEDFTAHLLGTPPNTNIAAFESSLQAAFRQFVAPRQGDADAQPVNQRV